MSPHLNGIALKNDRLKSYELSSELKPHFALYGFVHIHVHRFFLHVATNNAIIRFPTNYQCSSNASNYLFEGSDPMLSLT